jgi:hypothetical protein
MMIQLPSRVVESVAPAKAKDRVGKLQFHAGNELRISRERYPRVLAKPLAQRGTPFGLGFGIERMCGSDDQLPAVVSELTEQCLALCRGKMVQVVKHAVQE